MPSKETYLLFFLGTSVTLILAQTFVFFQLRRLLRRDFPDRAKKLVPIFRWVFIFMNIPIAFLFFRRQIHNEAVMLTQVMLYPFTIWQFLILLWTVILIPLTIVRLIRNRFRVTSQR